MLVLRVAGTLSSKTEFTILRRRSATPKDQIMSLTVAFPRGGYGFIKGVSQYSAGVAALSGYRIERVRFAAPVSFSAGFERIEAIIKSAGRPLAAFCACELRSPAPFTEADFRSFNEGYVGKLQQWGLIEGGVNPVARSNVCPAIDPPPEPGFHAFSFTIEANDAPPSFVIAGSGEAPEGKANYRDHIIARGDVSAAGLRRKAVWVLDEMERRMSSLRAAWRDATAVQLYTVCDIHPFLVGGDRAPRRRPARPHLAFRPAAGRRYRIRDGLPGSSHRARRRMTPTLL